MMNNKIIIKRLIKPFNKILEIEGDKSLSIRWALLASQAIGKSKSINILRSEDVLSTLSCLKKLGVKIKLSKDKCEINGLGLNGFKYKKNIVLNAGNSGTLGRLIMGLLVHAKNKIKIIGDQSLSKRDFFRVTKPLEKFGAKFKTNSGKLPITIEGTTKPKPIKYTEDKGSAQCKTAVMLAALNTSGETIIKAKKSRNHSELLFKYLGLPIKIKKKNSFDVIRITGKKKYKALNYKIPTDISSSAFFLVLTILSNNSKLKVKNVNINPSRTGIIKILRLMGAKIYLRNIKKYKGEKIADIYVESIKSLKAIKCPTYLNSSAIDEFLVIFLVAAKAKGISYFRDLSELNQKESPRLKWGVKILKMMGVKTISNNDSIKIFGNPDLVVNKTITIKNYLKDHRVFMTSVVAALTFGGNWKIYDKNSIRTSFPSFLKNIEELKR
ncbi:3-phosphoshikimate 1-carboxyvinyltransferase [Candidatus Pelagibacter communis]|uniref:3-phosphoshikimate 1-carboxyvinyltransferase n=1 Tax=Pelagibacter ubique TaxID=198252 RepID=UPI00211D0E8D|nr:3-phosphoshikimate 1-carboxyvinyltransferase [Candidatus Pelagibacter ubique]